MSLSLLVSMRSTRADRGGDVTVARALARSVALAGPGAVVLMPRSFSRSANVLAASAAGSSLRCAVPLEESSRRPSSAIRAVTAGEVGVVEPDGVHVGALVQRGVVREGHLVGLAVLEGAGGVVGEGAQARVALRVLAGGQRGVAAADEDDLLLAGAGFEDRTGRDAVVGARRGEGRDGRGDLRGGGRGQRVVRALAVQALAGGQVDDGGRTFGPSAGSSSSGSRTSARAFSGGGRARRRRSRRVR